VSSFGATKSNTYITLGNSRICTQKVKVNIGTSEEPNMVDRYEVSSKARIYYSKDEYLSGNSNILEEVSVYFQIEEKDLDTTNVYSSLYNKLKQDRFQNTTDD